MDDDDTERSKKTQDARWSDDHVQSDGPLRNFDDTNKKKIQSSRRRSVKELADEIILVSEEPNEPKVYAKFLLPNERVVYDSVVWKRAVSGYRPTPLLKIMVLHI